MCDNRLQTTSDSLSVLCFTDPCGTTSWLPYSRDAKPAVRVPKVARKQVSLEHNIIQCIMTLSLNNVPSTWPTAWPPETNVAYLILEVCDWRKLRYWLPGFNCVSSSYRQPHDKYPDDGGTMLIWSVCTRTPQSGTQVSAKWIVRRKCEL